MALVNVPIYPTRNLATTVDDEARRLVSGNGVTVIVNPDGSISLDISGALGPYVLKAGDTMTGPLVNTVGAIANNTSARVLSFYSDNSNGSSAIFFYRGAASPQGGLEFRTATGTAYGNLAMRINPDTTIQTFQKNIIDNGATGISGGHLSMRNTTTYAFDMGIGTSGPTDPDAFLVNRHASGSISFFTGSPGVRRGTVLTSGVLQWYQNIEINKTGTSDYLITNNTVRGTLGSNGSEVYLGSRSNHNLAFYTNNVLRGTANVAGTLLWNGAIQAANSSTTPLVLAAWSPINPAYSALRTAAMGGSEYMMLATDNGSDPNTYVSAKSTGNVTIRPNANSSTGQAVVSTTGLAVSGEISDTSGNVRNLFRLDALGSFGIVQAYRGSYIIKTVNGNITATINTNATTAITQGTMITFSVHPSNTGTLTLARAGGVGLWRNGTNADIVISPGQTVTIYKADTDTWMA